jgi:putative RNA 2'-phosphotransferase
MNPGQSTRRSKFLSMVLRHKPEKAAVQLDESGWVSVSDLISGCSRAGHPLTRDQLEEIVQTNSKKRFEFSPDGNFIRASQGHSVEVDLKYEPRIPPEVLYHGTAESVLDAIRTNGLWRMQRHHVHLSQDAKTALQVGMRHGKPVVLRIRAADMQREGHVFCLSTNGVWLVDHVPPQYIEFP